MFKNATFKLTVSYIFVVMLICLAFSLVVYRVGSNNLAYGLRSESQDLSSVFPIFNGTQFAAPNNKALVSGKDHLFDELVLTNIFVLVGAGFICYILAKETLKPIEEAHEQQKRFTADVSHELRTPLTALKMESEVALMDDHISKSDLKKVINSNIEEATKLESLINSLMRLTRIEAEELQKQFKIVNLQDLSNEAYDHMKHIAENKKIQIIIKVDPITFKGDHDSLVQMLVIFIDNALKYSPKGTAVLIESQLVNNQPSIRIIDHGPGIEKKDLDHIFDRFFRADSARSGSSGFGLGLSIAKLIGDVHHADITISSKVNYGTTACITFEQ